MEKVFQLVYFNWTTSRSNWWSFDYPWMGGYRDLYDEWSSVTRESPFKITAPLIKLYKQFHNVMPHVIKESADLIQELSSMIPNTIFNRPFIYMIKKTTFKLKQMSRFFITEKCFNHITLICIWNLKVESSKSDSKSQFTQYSLLLALQLYLATSKLFNALDSFMLLFP